MYLSAVTKTDVGRKRDHNEDFVTSFEPTEEHDIKNSGNLFIVADGVGGASQGEKASKYAAETVLYEYYNLPDLPPQARLQQIIQAAGNQINSYAEEGERFMRMATTMVAAVILDDTLIVANVGDSRAYLIRDNVANQVTKDHSFVGEMVRDGLMTEEEARTSKQKNRITRSLGGERDVRVDVFDGIKLADGDKILLCSDGFSQYASKETITSLARNGTAEEITNRMIAYANKKGGSDNISVILIKVSESPLDETLAMGMAKQPVRTQPIWDNLDTDHEEGTEPPQKDNFFFGLGKKNAAIAGGIGILFVCLIFTVAFLPLSPPKISVPPTAPSGAEAYAATETANAFVATSDTLNTQISNTSTAIALTSATTETPSPTPSPLPPSPPETEDPLNQPAKPLSTEQAFCQYIISLDDVKQYKNAMSDLLHEKFGINTGLFDHYRDNIAPLIQCADIEGNPCRYGEDFNGSKNYSAIGDGWVIKFPLEKLGISRPDCEKITGAKVISPPR